VFASFQGVVESIPIDKVNISIVANPDEKSDPPVPISQSGTSLAKNPFGIGRKLVFVRYPPFELPATYSIDIRDVDGGNDNGDGDVRFGEPIWK
jgi:hypothetical protein